MKKEHLLLGVVLVIVLMLSGCTERIVDQRTNDEKFYGHWIYTSGSTTTNYYFRKGGTVTTSEGNGTYDVSGKVLSIQIDGDTTEYTYSWCGLPWERCRCVELRGDGVFMILKKQ